ncbi:hypothetical protein SAMN05421640_3420 [Ekhidna lutea]|uniref:SusF/SusE family outer membrane protein n=1 Tax=Ekhidna lutea TaxID=447679 RepID=A0A239LX37_EKHLU|nr:hypothetical protein [Ekhidna lutea]SNT34438.1 hypothetical protein SAMN05421640_3420 [Ekhidna lutea]
MKNVLKSLSFLMVLGGLIFISSCGDDDGGIIIDDDGGGSFTVADGFYIAGVSGSDTTIANAYLLADAQVEGDGFAPTPRDEHKASYIYLSSGSYIFAEVDEQNIVSVEGGASAVVDSVGAWAEGYTYVEVESNGASFSVSEDGVYHVIYDGQNDEAFIVRVNSWGVIGGAVYESACVSNGFNADVDLETVSESAEGSTWSGTGIILRDDQFKFRYNNSWTIGEYKSFTNLGESLTVMVPGGANIQNAEDGIYDITLAMDADGAFSATLTRTGDAEECTFDPDNFPWGIIGSGTQGTETTAGWGDDKDLIYVGQNEGVDTWLGVFPIAGGTADNEFKFRTDGTWATKLIPNSTTYTDNTGNITDNADSNGDGSWFLADGASGFIYVKITTSDQGGSWNIEFSDAEFQVIGEGSPVGNWEAGNGIAMTYNDDLASATLASGSYTTAGWKIFVNQSFDYNVGGSLDGTTALEFNNSTFNLDAAGDYSVTISTADGGVTYTASATQN